MNWLKALVPALIAWLSSGATWTSLRVLVIEFLKSTFVKTILLKMFGSIVSGSYKAWIAKLIVEYAFEELAEPIIKLAFRKMGYVYNRIEGEIQIKKLNEAREKNDEKAYNLVIDDILK